MLLTKNRLDNSAAFWRQRSGNERGKQYIAEAKNKQKVWLSWEKAKVEFCFGVNFAVPNHYYYCCCGKTVRKISIPWLVLAMICCGCWVFLAIRFHSFRPQERQDGRASSFPGFSAVLLLCGVENSRYLFYYDLGKLNHQLVYKIWTKRWPTASRSKTHPWFFENLISDLAGSRFDCLMEWNLRRNVTTCLFLSKCAEKRLRNKFQCPGACEIIPSNLHPFLSWKGKK